MTDLNQMQQQAVDQTEGPVLILAGAGSGKTRVITYRIAHLISLGIPEDRILALTFTNKAAGEMRDRVERIAAGGSRVWVATFHSFCAKILRRHIEKLGYKPGFTIYDDSDTLGVVKMCMRELNIDEGEITPKTARYVIDDAKNQGITSEEFDRRAQTSGTDEIYASIYSLYEKKCKANNALDFNDLLLKTLELFHDYKDVLDYYAQKFEYIHVDEYQDTNDSQYELVRLLASKHGNLCVVGDDDQSIYGWRGASIRNILEFEKDFKNTTVIRLEQNYRSTSRILDAANSVISHNLERKAKKLWTQGEEGKPIIYYRGYTERDEATYVVTEIRRMIREELREYKDIAILYRTNAQSRIVEEAFMRNSIPYNIYGGLKFYSRKEIKDIIAYLTVAANPDDDVAMRRIIGVPKKGIGNVTVEALDVYASEHGLSLYDAIIDCDEVDIKAGAKSKLKEFGKLLNTLIAKGMTMPVGEYVQEVLECTGLISQYEEKETEENISRIDNSYEFMDAAKEFQNMSEESTLGDFLENIMLVTDMDRSDDSDNKVSMMTMHSAKGLEYPVVFILGMEQGLFPSYMSVDSEKGIEEERRLCYVGITRAKEQLYLTNAESRMMFGKSQSNAPSVFIEEIPEHLLEKQFKEAPFGNEVKQSYSRSNTPASAVVPRGVNTVPENTELAPGQKVSHKKFGEGTVIKVEGSGDSRLVSIAFDGAGIKKLSTAYAPLKVL